MCGPSLPNMQAQVTPGLLNQCAGLFHTTRKSALTPILQEGILPMSRAASMYAMFGHVGVTSRAIGMQRCDTYIGELSISFDPEPLTEFGPMRSRFVDEWDGLNVDSCPSPCL